MSLNLIKVCTAIFSVCTKKILNKNAGSGHLLLLYHSKETNHQETVSVATGFSKYIVPPAGTSLSSLCPVCVGSVELLAALLLTFDPCQSRVEGWSVLMFVAIWTWSCSVDVMIIKKRTHTLSLFRK